MIGVADTPSVSIVRGVIGVRASVTTYTLSAADFIAFYNPRTRHIEHVAISQGSLTCDAGAQGRDGRDQAGAFTASTWVYLYYTWDGTTVATRLSATAPPTGPTLANGETSWAFVAALRWNASSNFIDSYVRGDTVFYQAHQAALSAGTAAAYTSIDLAAFVPPQAIAPLVHGRVRGYANGASKRAAETRLSLDGTAEWQALVSISATGAIDYENNWVLVLPNISQAINYKTDSTADFLVTGYSNANRG